MTLLARFFFSLSFFERSNRKILNLSELGENVAQIQFGIGFRNAKKKKPQLVLTHPIYSVGVEKNYYEMDRSCAD
jgi:hypothetical protein